MAHKSNKNHINISGRIRIETYIEKGSTSKAICHLVPTSYSSLYREILRNSKIVKSNHFKCLYIAKCSKEQRAYCGIHCSRYVQVKCKKLCKFPFVCNVCEKRSGCALERRFYRADYANAKAIKRLKETRQGIRISPSDFKAIDEIISPLVINKQSLNHILTTHDEIDVSERTIRNWINHGFMHAKTIDLARTVTFKVKKEYIHRIVKPSSILMNRMYQDYKKYIKENPNLLVSQFDTVLGLISDHKRILTIHFPSIHFQFGILLEDGTSEEVCRVLTDLRNKIGIEEWKRIFPVMLTDNGLEFYDLYKFEVNSDGEIVSRVFYCDAYKSGQKGACERNHELYRYIQPKKHSIEYLTQNILNNYFSNINCLYRKSLSGIRPYDLAVLVLGKKFLDAIGIREILPDNVTFVKSKLVK